MMGFRMMQFQCWTPNLLKQLSTHWFKILLPKRRFQQCDQGVSNLQHHHRCCKIQTEAQMEVEPNHNTAEQAYICYFRCWQNWFLSSQSYRFIDCSRQQEFSALFNRSSARRLGGGSATLARPTRPRSVSSWATYATNRSLSGKSHHIT